MNKKLVWVLGLLFGIVAGSANAAIVLRTGVDNNAVMSPGSIDTDWKISTDGKQTFTDTKVLYPAQICCGMETVGNTAAWIGDPSITPTSAGTAWGINRDVYIRTSFDLTGYDLSTVGLAGNWRLADWTFGIYLNNTLLAGTDIGNCGGNQGSCGTWFSDRALSVAVGSPLFVAGVNTIEFRGQSINSIFDGLWFDGTVSGRQVGGQVPLPGTLSLVALGALALRLARRRG